MDTVGAQSTSGPEHPEPVPSGGHSLARVFGVLFTPAETFAGIARRPNPVPPLLLLMVFSLLLTVTIGRRIGVEQIVQKQFEENQRFQDMPAERRAEMMERMMPFVRYSMYLGPLVFLPLMILVVSGVMLLMTNFVLGAEARYSSVLSVTAYAFLPGCIVALLAIVILFLKDPADVDIQNIVAANLSLLFDPRANKALHRLGASLDLFSFWQIALLSTGVAAAGRVSFKKGLAAVIFPWAVWVLGVTGWAAMFA